VEAPQAYNDDMKSAFNKACPAVENSPYLLFLSRIHPKKGVDLLVQAYIQVHRSVKGIMPKLVIAGPGMDTEYGEMILKLLQNAPDVSKDVIFPGMLKGDAKWGAFYGCEAFVLPSHQENFGIAVVEALACAKPVLISNQVNIWREILEAGGGLIDSDNLPGTRNILQQWVGLTNIQKATMSAKALAAYQSRFTIDSFTGNFFKAFADHD
jgi:glycosyltransferase involved in cell wall biosynthesis